jgi:predicted hotdog family 3-hydroxylacyl-ACP dehydratase
MSHQGRHAVRLGMLHSRTVEMTADDLPAANDGTATRPQPNRLSSDSSPSWKRPTRAI